MMNLLPQNDKFPSYQRLNTAFLILVIPALIWWAPLLSGNLPDFMDTVTELYPMRVAAARQIWSGELPLWLPNIFSGVPLAANPQVAVWYPPQWIFFLIPNALGNGLVLLFHYLLAGWGTFFLARRFGCLILPAAMAGFFFQFGSMMVSRIALTPHLYTAAWIPLIFLAIEYSIRAKPQLLPTRSTLLVAAALGMQLLAGGPQISYYTCLILPIYWLVRAYQQHRIGQALLQGAFAALFAASFAAIQLVPTLEYIGQTTRHGLEIEALKGQGLNGSYLWSALVGFSAPTLEDTDTINAIGTGALLLIPLAFLHKRKRKSSIAFMLIGILAYTLALGICVPVFCKILPLFQNFHAPRRALILWSVVGPVLAGFGCQYLYISLRKKHFHRYIIWGIFAIIMSGNLWILPRLERVFVTPQRFLPPPEYVEAIGKDRFLSIDPSMSYSYDSRRDDYGFSMMPDMAAWFDYRDVQGYDPLYPERYATVRDIASSGSISIYASHGVFFTNPASPVLDLLNVQYMVGRYDLYEPGMVVGLDVFFDEMIEDKIELVYDHDQWPLYKFKENRPAAWPVSAVFLALSPEESLTSVLNNVPYRTAFIENGIQFQTPGPLPEIKTDFKGGSTISLSLSHPTTAQTFVVVSSNWMPGWKASIQDGTPLEVFVTNGFQLGVTVPPNVQQITFKYSPRSFWIGLFITLGGLLFAISIFTVLNPSRKIEE